MTKRLRTFPVLLFTLLLTVLVAGATVGLASTADASVTTSPSAAKTTPYSKVMVIAEENEAESGVIGSADAPYISKLAKTYGQATQMQAGYPTECPSLAAYIIITSGSQHEICDDAIPAKHQISGDNVFQQVAAAGKQWAEYAESMPEKCTRTDSTPYLVRHAPPPYYVSEKTRCKTQDVPLGTTSSGALVSALKTGLPSYSFVTPNACDDMHGADGCRTGQVKRGDTWLSTWMPKIIASQDFQQGRLLVIVTWDEGTNKSNHIPTVLVGRGIEQVASGAAYTHCSTLRAAEDIVGLPRIGCAKTAVSFGSAFGW